MKKFTVNVQYVFKGKYIVKADSKEEAHSIVKNDCGLVLGGNIHTVLNDDKVDWDFDTHPEEIIEE